RVLFRSLSAGILRPAGRGRGGEDAARPGHRVRLRCEPFPEAPDHGGERPVRGGEPAGPGRQDRDVRLGLHRDLAGRRAGRPAGGLTATASGLESHPAAGPDSDPPDPTPFTQQVSVTVVAESAAPVIAIDAFPTDVVAAVLPY